MEPARERMAGARIVLRSAPPICESEEAIAGWLTRGDTELAPVWDWGHTELSFHPDLAGFRRVASNTNWPRSTRNPRRNLMWFSSPPQQEPAAYAAWKCKEMHTMGEMCSAGGLLDPTVRIYGHFL